MKTLIDGDIVKFRCGMAGEKSTHNVYIKEEQAAPSIFSSTNLNEVKSYLKDSDLSSDSVEIVSTKNIEPIENVLHSVKHMLMSILDRTEAEDYTIYLSGKGNFREVMAEEVPYKGNRWSEKRRDQEKQNGRWTDWLMATEAKHTVARRPYHEDQIVKYLCDVWGAVVVDGIEADDALGIASMKFAQRKEKTCIVSIDKDLLMIPGLHFNFVKDEWSEVSELEGYRSFYRQVLTGDSTDNVPGIKGIGDVGATKLLKGCSTVEDMRSIVLLTYMESYEYEGLQPKDILRKLNNRQNLLWIKRKEDPDELPIQFS